MVAIDRLAVVAIDVGGTSLKAGIIGPAGLGALRRVPSRRELGPDAVVDNIGSVAAGLIEEGATLGLDVVGIGIAVPGIIDADGVGRLSVTIGWHDLPVRARLAERLGRAVIVGHDVRSGAVAEITFGAAAGARSALFVPIGTGVAAALVVDGVIHPGATFRAGEIGQVHVGRGTTLEAVASARAIAERYAARAGRAIGSVDAEEVVALVRDGDGVATAVWDVAIDALATVLAAAVALVDVEVLVVGGGLGRAGSTLLAPLAAAMAKELPWRELPRVVGARFGADAGFVGAALDAWRRGAGRNVGELADAVQRGVGWRRRGGPTVIIAGRVVTANDVVTGWVETAGDRIASVGGGSPPAGAAGDRGWTIVPGFIDVHVHGGGGHTFTMGEPDAIAAAAAFHLAGGTTTTLLSLVTAPIDELEATATRIAGFLGDAEPALRRRIAGIHAEGPFLSTARCGAQDPSAMSDPDPELVDRLVAAGGGLLRMITLAPERRGAVEAVRQLVGAGVLVAIGHSDATFEQAAAAIGAGATVATHLGNAMSPLHHRDPGMVGACLTAGEVCCELIVDGHHLHPSFFRLASVSKGADGFMLITDAIAAAGVGDGRYQLGRFDVDVSAGMATLVDGGSLAGSTLTMDAAWRNAVATAVDEVTASRAASLNPARLLGIDGYVGSIETGKRADLVVLDEGRAVVAVIAAGDVVAGTLD